MRVRMRNRATGMRKTLRLIALTDPTLAQALPRALALTR